MTARFLALYQAPAKASASRSLSPAPPARRPGSAVLLRGVSCLACGCYGLCQP
jgi:hypothetical protein